MLLYHDNIGDNAGGGGGGGHSGGGDRRGGGGGFNRGGDRNDRGCEFPKKKLRHRVKYLFVFCFTNFQRVISVVVAEAVVVAVAIVLVAQDAIKVRCAVAEIVEMIEIVHIK